MNKKKIFKIVFFILIVIACLAFLYNRDKNYVPIEEIDANRIESIKEYDARNNSDTKTDISDSKIQGINNGESVVLTNRAAFLQKFKDKDVGIAIANNLIPSSLNYINYIITDCEEDNIDKYYESNKDTIFNVFGIDNISQFTDLFNKVKPLGEIGEITIDINTVETAPNSANFSINIKGKNATTTLYIEANVSDKNTLKASFYLKDSKE